MQMLRIEYLYFQFRVLKSGLMQKGVALQMHAYLCFKSNVVIKESFLNT